MKRVTMPPLPWDVVPPDHPAIIEPAPHHVRKLILDAFTGTVDHTDLQYMARALLQMSDEIFEMCERIKALELAFIAKKG